ncbi:NAD(P)-binding protein [Bacillus sp. 31A1R]|uniref:precorrin-2 dehydrogenase n=1 Tax=Robertmurraya mangrovi TaxID=3098077 RepID=A0ABU5J0R2_9BACI|nr:NAD(P)-binding protein [Bacillus sp. 31A1R]MDZ5473008.1 NAD(P)-binding protein [Bacillus sp. 31A1R]
MEEYYPVSLQLKGKVVVVIGGGKIAERKIKGLLNTGAKIELISPTITEGLKGLVEATKIKWLEKSFSPEDVNDAFLILAATNDRATNQAVQQAVNPYQLLNLADQHEESNFIIPSVMRRGKLNIAVTTSGASPTLSKQIKKQLEETYDERYESYIDFLFRCRQYVLKHVSDTQQKKKILSSLVDDPIYFKSVNRDALFLELLHQDLD